MPTTPRKTLAERHRAAEVNMGEMLLDIAALIQSIGRSDNARETMSAKVSR